MGIPSTNGSRRRPLHVLHLVSTFAVKTDTKWLLQIARHSDPEAVRLSAACFYRGGPVQEQLENLGVSTFNLDITDERDPRAILRARRLIQQQNCDVVHTHLLRADLFGGLAARWAGAPAIVSTVYAIGAYRRATQRRTDPLLDAACAVLPTHFIAVAQAVADDVVARMKIDPKRIQVIHTGIEPPEQIDADRVATLRREWTGGWDKRLVVSIARLSYEKGIDTLIDAAAKLRQVHPGVRVVVVGDGPDRDALQRRIDSNGLGETMMLAGFCEDVWPAIAAADVICLPSKSEGLPNALLEAMAVGRPVVATAAGGMPEVIEHEVNGLIVPAENPAALAAALERVTSDRALGERLGAAARQTIADRFHARDVIARYTRFYQRLLPERSDCLADVGAVN